MKKIYEKPELNMTTFNLESVIAAASGSFNNNIYTPNDVEVEWEDLF